MKIKNHLLILSALAVMLSANSCKKGDSSKFCVDCTVKTTITSPGVEPDVKEQPMEECDLTQKDYDDLLKVGNLTTTATVGGVVYTSKMETTCKKR